MTELTVLEGNNITIKWTITKCDGTSENISDSAVLYISDAFNKILINKANYSVSGGVVSMNIKGNLLVEGRYSLILVDGDSKRFVRKNVLTITNNPDEVTADCNV